jgi:broad specificity phosphatase PhoE
MILLARHGQTDDNVPPLRFQGQRDTPLNDVGRAQARELAERVVALDPPIAALWSSDLSRARETAEIVGARLEMEPRTDARLREGWRGDWEGRLFDDVARAEPDAFAAWRRAGAAFRFPGGEALGEQQARVLAALAEIEGRGELPALVVCHGGSIRTVLCARDPRGLDAFHTWELPNAAIVELDAVPAVEAARR